MLGLRSPGLSGTTSQGEHAEKRFPVVGLHVFQHVLDHFSAELVSSPQVEDRPHINGTVPLILIVQGGFPAGGPHGAQQGLVAAVGSGIAPQSVAQVLLLVTRAADAVGRLAVDEVQAVTRDVDLIVLQLQASMAERLAHVFPPFHGVGNLIVQVTCEEQERDVISG